MAAKVQEELSEQSTQLEQERAGATARQPLDWKLIILTGLVLGAGWTALYVSGPQVQFLAGVVPILVGFYLGRRLKHRPIMHSALVALIGLVAMLPLLLAYAYAFVPAAVQDPTRELDRQGFLIQGLIGALIVFPFAIYGTFISQRGKQQREQQQAVIKRRGGRLENPGRVRDVEDLRGLPLPKLAAFVVRVFQKHGFKLEDYLFDNKDNIVDVYMTHEDERWLLRCTVVDKVKPGMVQGLAQKMRGEEIKKGVVLTSTEFMDSARRWADNQRDLQVVDGETLWQMSQS